MAYMVAHRYLPGILERWQAELAKDLWLHGDGDLFEILGS